VLWSNPAAQPDRLGVFQQSGKPDERVSTRFSGSARRCRKRAVTHHFAVRDDALDALNVGP